WNFFADNSRIPDLIWGDLQAMMAGLALLDARTQELCDRYGTAELLESIDDVLALSELKARAAIATLTDGEYSFNEYLETFRGDGHIYVQAKLVKSGETLSMDFSGSDPQVRYALNFTTSERPHPFLCMPFVNYIQTVEPTIPMTSGIIRPISTRAPKGTFMNATFPAAMGNRWVAVMRVYDAILGCLNQALPGGIAAAGSGQAGIISIASVNERTGQRHVSVVEPFIAGSAAPGKFRGGYAMRIELENRNFSAVMTVRGLERFRFQPWGIAGGRSASAASVVLNPGRNTERNIGRIDVLDMERGDLLRMITPSGGGYGDPFTRDPATVLEEVLDGLVSVEQARTEYGVVIAGG